MSTVEERFETMHRDATHLLEVSEHLYDLGIYGSQDQAALTILLTTVTSAMRVLDPEGTKRFYDSVLRERAPRASTDFSAGSYL